MLEDAREAIKTEMAEAGQEVDSAAIAHNAWVGLVGVTHQLQHHASGGKSIPGHEALAKDLLDARDLIEKHLPDLKAHAEANPERIQALKTKRDTLPRAWAALADVAGLASLDRTLGAELTDHLIAWQVSKALLPARAAVEPLTDKIDFEEIARAQTAAREPVFRLAQRYAQAERGEIALSDLIELPPELEDLRGKSYQTVLLALSHGVKERDQKLFVPHGGFDVMTAQLAVHLERAAAALKPATQNYPAHTLLGIAAHGNGPAAEVLGSLWRMRFAFDDVARAAGAAC
jgi:hypothetical protein